MIAAPITVPVAEWKRHLCIPIDGLLSETAQAGVERALAWVNEHGCSWSFVSKPVNLAVEGDFIRLASGTQFTSRALAEKLRRGQARSAVAVACSAGPGVPAEIQRLWDAQRPDEAFFLNAAAAAATEQLLLRAQKSICDQVEPAGLAALPHESPGYDGWELGQQRTLLGLLAAQSAWPSAAKLSLLESGMLSPEHSQLALFGLGPSAVVETKSPDMVACARCSMDPCSYRRVPDAGDAQALPPPASSGAVANGYAYPDKALRRWSRELLTVDSRDEQSVRATFRPECKTCSNLGVPFGIDYSIELGSYRDGFPIRKLSCRPSDSDYQSMCSNLKDPEEFPCEMVRVPAFVDQPLVQVLEWDPAVEPAGCLCRPPARDHKWKIALQTVHYKLHTDE
ncbi:MAG: hypothetical protein QF721_08500 [Verrucomicrobiota bacterium]|jgi:hypothetical protein|nr:hypothetical protein [Verrucomicrobiota bacterium]